jgi:hypothetical protein
MGTWEAGNFDNDEALDYVAEIQAPLLHQLEHIIADPHLAEPDEPTSARVMAAAEILAILCEQCNAVPPKPDIVTQCQEAYLPVWDGYIDRLEPDPEYKLERRKVIQATFERLLNLARQWHK